MYKTKNKNRIKIKTEKTHKSKNIKIIKTEKTNTFLLCISPIPNPNNSRRINFV